MRRSWSSLPQTLDHSVPAERGGGQDNDFINQGSPEKLNQQDMEVSVETEIAIKTDIDSVRGIGPHSFGKKLTNPLC